jgi:acyl-CoA hydrolase
MLSKTEHNHVIDNFPGHPGNKMGVYMETLIDELVHAWEEGVWTYNRATKTNFKMHV